MQAYKHLTGASPRVFCVHPLVHWSMQNKSATVAAMSDRSSKKTIEEPLNRQNRWIHSELVNMLQPLKGHARLKLKFSPT